MAYPIVLIRDKSETSVLGTESILRGTVLYSAALRVCFYGHCSCIGDRSRLRHKQPSLQNLLENL